jgi:hypothetical protein
MIMDKLILVYPTQHSLVRRYKVAGSADDKCLDRINKVNNTAT